MVMQLRENLSEGGGVAAAAHIDGERQRAAKRMKSLLSFI
jgi:hypothetical protein